MDFSFELYERLRRIRRRLAGNQPPFAVCTNKALEEMARRLPLSRRELEAIPGFGPKRAALYGEAFLSAIRYFVRLNPDAKQTRPQTQEDSPARQEQKRRAGETQLETYRYYRQGLNLQDIAARRNLQPDTIVQHLCQLMEWGWPIKINHLVPEAKQEAILAVAGRVGSDRLKPIKEQLPPDYTYAEIRLVLASRGRKKAPR